MRHFGEVGAEHKMLYDRKKFRECACVNMRACVYVWDEGGRNGEVGGGGEESDDIPGNNLLPCHPGKKHLP